MLDSVIRQSPVSGTAQGFSQRPLSYSGITPSVIVADIYGGLREDSVKRINFANIFFLTLAFCRYICVQFFSPGIMTIFWRRSSWLSALLGFALFVLTAGNIGPNHDRRQASSSSCFGGFDLYFVLDK